MAYFREGKHMHWNRLILTHKLSSDTFILRKCGFIASTPCMEKITQHIVNTYKSKCHKILLNNKTLKTLKSSTLSAFHITSPQAHWLQELALFNQSRLGQLATMYRITIY